MFCLVLPVVLFGGCSSEVRQGAADESCTVGYVFDGDTLRVRCAGESIKVRLYCIDAPEMGQAPWGCQSRDWLRRLLPRGDDVRVRFHERDRYGRWVAEVLIGGRNVNLALVESGRAAVYPHYCDAGGFYTVQRQAKEAGRGIWSSAGDHQRPWDWRRSAKPVWPAD